ncbi:hypothetical protein AJ79_04732 [Helicocarpus griseus UAMH5409]|uniref:Methyltransferase domain-containing protein n=1 Tax=Helicocarpus griseus UAMH5409 TaxID=1447875 RepID=A0A2B7XRX5_9EURO|nr:hypothetical protein AJ79_04732 [Helicocarpus griseus UAMH5409]
MAADITLSALGTENDRLDILHHMVCMVLNGALHLAPIGKDTKRILDIGTGTGIWATEMGESWFNPSLQILGVDLSPIQPKFVPTNVRFEIDDVESPWTYTKPFDYIHSRYMVASIENWPALVKRAYENLKPGGWVEFQDFDINLYPDDGTLMESSDLRRWNVQLIDGYRKLKREPCPGPLLKGLLQNAGFQNITHRQWKMPTGPWPKDKDLKTLGAYNLLQLLEGFEGFSLAPFTRALGWTADEVQILVEGVKKDIQNPKIHSQFDFHVAYAQKPL